MKFWIDDKELVKEIEDLKKSIPAAGEAAVEASAEVIAFKLRDRVRQMIPDKGGWYDIYKDAITVIKVSKDRYEIEARVNEIKFGSIEADNSLIWISSGDDVAAVLAQHNPWTLDTIPSVADGFTSDLIVRPASESEIEFHRSQRLAELTMIHQQMATIGKPAQEFDAELPRINGKVLADVPFLVERLEHGLGGFPRTPIWSRLDVELKAIKQSEPVKKKAESVFAARWRRKK